MFTRKNKTLVPLVIFLVAAIGAATAWLIYWPIESQRYAATQKVEHSGSVIRMAYMVTHQRGPISREQLIFSNVDGKAQVAYEGTNRPGTAIARFTQSID